ncbi:MAG TPA: hypothetical protein VGQ27_04570, partial [Steroidobacteraceae bacterium]|nr:hypothetical protein [Steroidobacteraceae bacterium]
MDVRGELKPGRDFIITLGLTAVAAAAIFGAPGPVFPVLHTILNTGIALGTAAVSLLFWDLGWRTREPLIRYLAVVFAVAGVLEIQHVLAALDPATGSDRLNSILWGLRSGTWAPPAYLLPLGAGAALLVERRPGISMAMFVIVLIACGLGLFALFQTLRPYTPKLGLGIIRPSLLLIPLLWIPVGLTFWRRRRGDRIAHALSYFALGLVLS